jgi:nitrilase
MSHLKATKLKVAAIHASPVFMNKAKTLEKALGLIAKAGEEKVDLLNFPECFLPSFPFWCFCYAPVKYTEVIPEYIDQSVEIDGPEVAAISAACRAANVAVCMGVSERAPGSHTIFNSQFFFDRDGTFVGVHRKTQPTFMERSIWAQGSGYTMRNFYMKDGYALGGLICWEHTMNLARHTLIMQGEQIHCAAWPSYSTMYSQPKGGPDSQMECLMKNHAMTGQTFVLCSSHPIDQGCLDWMEEKLGKQDFLGIGGGWSAIVDPYTLYAAGPVTGLGDQMLTAEIDLSSVQALRSWCDSAGHYGRPEIFKLMLNDKPIWPFDEASISKSQRKPLFGAPKPALPLKTTTKTDEEYSDFVEL